MQYIGGKSHIAKHLTPYILQTNPTYVIEPFCGALNVSVELVKLKPSIKIFASDSDSDLINMWQAVKEGWIPPDYISEQEYKELKNSEPSPLRTFVGYGCSFGGKWFGGYAKNKTERNYCLGCKNSIIKKMPHLDKIQLSSYSFSCIKITKIPNVVMYCDPPYFGTTKPGKQQEFNHDEFWKWIKFKEIPVYVSEYIAPDFMKEIWSKEVKTHMHTKNGKDKRIEKLFWNGI